MRMKHWVTAGERLVEPGHHAGHCLVRESSGHLKCYCPQAGSLDHRDSSRDSGGTNLSRSMSIKNRLLVALITITWIVPAVSVGVSVTTESNASAASTLCTGYGTGTGGCNASTYTTHGYNSSTNQKSYWGAVPGNDRTNYGAHGEEYTYGVPSPGNTLGNAAQWGTDQAITNGATVNTVPTVGCVAWRNSTAG